MAKRAREQALKERRERKQAKKDAAAALRAEAAGTADVASEDADDEGALESEDAPAAR